MKELIVETRGNALWITIDRPARRNAMTEPVILGIADALAQAGRDPAVRVAVVTGAGDKAFCAGADLQTGTSFEFDYATPSLPFANLLRAAHAATVPLVARVNGACMAGGMGLLAMCDMAVAAEHAIFGLPEVKVGVFPMQVLSCLQRIVPSRALYELCLTGEPVDARQAQAIGLVNHLAPAQELDARVDWLVGRLADKSPAAIRRGRYAMRRIEAMSFEESISFTESQIGLVSMTKDAREGLLAFREKRKPVWTGS
ncbi:enoyl-CoA hydratase/isomerase family protein [Pigmentiphaga soli]|uniref:Enoyl-CoA hydratase/isomerase family protein n=1 Tax=Pigmentiphaga soli TaxID=1007095 RepID=A0ABP8GKQ7_9BURK